MPALSLVSKVLAVVTLLPLLGGAAALAAPPEHVLERRLDPGLTILYRAQTGRAPVMPGRAREALGRLQGPTGGQGRFVTPPLATARLRLLVDFRGERAALASVGFAVEARVGSIVTGTLAADRLPEFAALPGVRFVQTSRRLLARLAPAAKREEAGGGGSGLTAFPASDMEGTGVLVGYVDTGVDVFHQDFRDDATGNTRIRFLLDLSDPGDVDGDGVLDGAGPFGGTLYTEADINAALSAGPPFASIDPTGHGSHGLSIAAGDDATLPGIAPAADLVVVKATREVDALGFFSADVVNALSFVDQKATELAMPYVANLSLGTLFSSHDGRSLEEQAIDALVGPGEAGKAVVVAAGNSSDNTGTELHHFSDTAYVGLSTAHTLTVPAYTPNAGTGNDRILFDVWYEGRDELSVAVTGPSGCGSPTVTAAFGTFQDVSTACGDVFIANVGGAHPANGDVEAIVLVDDFSGTEPVAGDWTLTFTGEAIGDTGVYHGWLADESVVGSTAPYLSANADNRYLVGKPGGAFHAVTVGSFARDEAGTRFLISWTDVNGIARTDTSAVDEEISDFSSPGPTRDGRIKPELTAPGERVMGAVAAKAYPTDCSGDPTSIYCFHPFAKADALIVDDTAEHAFGMLQGSSFSAPVVTGLVARILSTDPSLDAIQVRNILLNSILSDGFTGTGASDEWGWGKADLTVGGDPLPQDLRIDDADLPDGILGRQYGHVLTASGGTLPYGWSVTDIADLPPGLELEPSGFLTGAPTAAGTYSFTIQAVDSSSPSTQTHSRAFTVEIAAEPPLRITRTAFPVARIDKPYESQVTAEGGTSPYTFTVVGGSLPPGLTLGTDGTIDGTPTALGRFDFTVQVEDTAPTTARRGLHVKVKAAGAAEWDALGRDAPVVNEIAFDSNDPLHMFVPTRGVDAVFESFDGGESWRPISINRGLGSFTVDIFVNRVTSEPWVVQHVEGTNSDTRVYRYDAANEVWVDRGLSTPEAIAGNSSGAIFISNGSNFQATLTGGSWTTLGSLCEGNRPPAVPVGPPKGSIAVWEDDERVYLTRWGSATTCISTNGGSNWNDITNLSRGMIDIEVSSLDRENVIKAGYDLTYSFVETSLFGGSTWSRFDLAETSGTCCLDRSQTLPDLALLGSSDGLFDLRISPTDGSVVAVSLPILGSIPNVTAVGISPVDESVFYVGSDLGFYKTEDGGQSWARKDEGLVLRALRQVTISPAAPRELLLSSDRGPYLSRTGGSRWTLSREGLGTEPGGIGAISALEPALYYFAPTTGRFFVSDTTGVSWTEPCPTGACSPDPQFADFPVVAVDTAPGAADTVVVALTGSRGVWRSTDRGASWANVRTGLPFTQPTAVLFASDGTLYATFPSEGTGEDGIFKSDDLGDTWSPHGLTDLTVNEVAAAPSLPGYLYVNNECPDADANLVCDVPGQVYFFDPGVGAWQAATTNPGVSLHSLVVDPNDHLRAYGGGDHPGTGGEGSGIFLTTDGGVTWGPVASPMGSNDVVSLAHHPNDSGVLFAATRFGGVFASKDGGGTWTQLGRYGTVADLTNVNVIDPTNPFKLFAGTEGFGAQASVDGGTTYTPMVTGLGNLFVNALAFDPDDATVLYAGTDAGVYKSIDGGSSWSQTALSAGEITDLVTDNDGTARRIWITVRGEGVAFSNDGGTSFQTFSEGLASLELTSIEIEDTGTARRIWITTHGGQGIAFSDDLGQTWTSAAGNGLTDRAVNDVAIDAVARRIWITADTGVFFSDDSGLSWSELSLGLPSGVPVTSATIDPNTGEVLVSLFGEDGGGVYRGGNLRGIWSEYNSGLEELKVKKLTNDNGRRLDATSFATTFFAATAGDGVYRSEIRFDQEDSPQITTHQLPDAIERREYSATLAASGGTPSYFWNVHEGSLPSGIGLDGETGALSGEPGQLGFFTFTIQVSDANGQLDRRQFTMEVIPPDEVAVLSCAPSSGVRGETLDVTVAGSLFQDGAVAGFGAGVTVNSTTFVDGFEITANVTIDGAADPGFREVTVTNPDASSASLVDCFKVDFPDPVVSSVDPAQGSRTTSLTVGVFGDFFDSGVVADFGADVAVDATVRVSQTELAVDVTIGATAALGPRAVTVTNSSGLSGSLADAFEILPAPPAVSAIDPAEGNQGTTVNVVVTGADFQAGAVAGFGAGVITNSTAFDSATQLTANVTIDADSALGLRTVTVTNPDAQEGSLADAFNVMGPAPHIFSLSPDEGLRGTILDVVISGSDFQAGIEAVFGPGITVNSTTLDSDTQVTTNVTVDPAAAVGPRGVTVTNADGQSATLSDGFEVTASPPQLSSVSPDQGGRESTLDVTLDGADFLSGAVADFGSGVVVNATTFVSAAELTANVTVDPAAALGPRTVTVTNPDAQQTSLADAFEVLGHAPEVVSVAPETTEPCETIDLVVKGDHFQDGVVVDLGAGVEVASVTFESSTRITVRLRADRKALKGERMVTVTNPDGQSGSAVALFGVLPPGYLGYPTGFSWIDASAGTATGIVGDDVAATIFIGFPFDLFGVAYDQVTVSSNGYLTFGGDGTDFQNLAIPDPAAPNPLIAVFWDDLEVPDPGSITYQVFGTEPERRLVVQWTSVSRVGVTGTATFQVVLHEASGAILYQYLDTDFGTSTYDAGASASIGISDEAGATGVQIGFDSPVAPDGSAFLVGKSKELPAQTVDSTALFEACHTLIVGPDFRVGGAGDVTLEAGAAVVLDDGFAVETGGALAVGTRGE